MKKTLFIIIFSLIASNFIFANKIPIPEPNSYVTELTKTLYDYQIKDLENKLYNFAENNTGQIVVLFIPSTGEESIEEFSIRVAEQWKIGSAENDDGVILIIAKNDRKLRIEVGYGFEEIITDAEAAYIINEIILPSFKIGDFNTGITNGIDRIIGLVNGVSPTLNEIKKQNNKNNEGSNDTLFILIIIIIVLFLFKKLTRKSLIGILLLNSGGSSSGSSRSSSSFGRSGFSGRGGSFGGGGASGSW